MINFQNPDAIALVLDDNKISYSHFSQKVNNFASHYIKKSCYKVAIFAENSLEWIYACYASLQSNCLVVPIDFMASPDDVAYILDDCKPDLIFIGKETIDSYIKVSELSSHKPQEVNLGKGIGIIDVDNVFWRKVPDKEQTAFIIYTSGTTGKPKGVMLSYKNLLTNIEAVKEVNIYNNNTEVLALLPFHHIFPLLGTMVAPIYVGGKIVFSSSMQSAVVLETLAKNKVNLLIGVPRLYELFYKGIKAKIDARFITRFLFKTITGLKNRKLAKKVFNKVHESFGGHIEYMVSGGAPLSKEVGNFFHYLGFNILEGYGMTEASPMITFPRPDRVVIGTCGQALTNTEVKIVDGEVIARGNNIMQGYYNRPDETAEVIKNGWLHSGDLGKFDKNGNLIITGRKKEIIVTSNGKNINPVELEMKLEAECDCIKEAGIFLDKDTLHAVVLPDFSCLRDVEAKDPQKYLRSFLEEFNSKQTNYKRILKLSLVQNELPRTRLGKLQRFHLPDLIVSSEKKETHENEPDNEVYGTIRVFIEEQSNVTISPDDHLEFDIALDSLGKLGLLDYIQNTFGISLDETKLLSFPSVRKLAEHIRDNKIFHKVENFHISDFLSEKKKFKLPKSTFLTFSRNVSVLFRKLFFRVKITGDKNIPDGACIIAPNHQSFLDVFLIISFFNRKLLKETYFYAKKEHVKSGFRKFLANRGNVIIMDLQKDLKDSVQKLAEVLRLGKKIMIFPEGTRTKNGDLGEFKKTYALLSTELNIPVVPVAIDGAFSAMPPGKSIPRFGTKINISVLNPVKPENLSAYELNEKVRGITKEFLYKE